MSCKIAQLVLTPGQRSHSLTEVFVSQPDAQQEELGGKIFFIAQIDSLDSDYLKIINFLAGEIEHGYYQSEKMILREKVSSIGVENVFEAALAKINREFADFVKKEKIKFSPAKLNITAGVIYENKIHFSQIGKNKALLVYKNKGDEKYKIANVAEQAASEINKKININKLFPEITSGVLPAAGYLLFSNEALPEYLSGRQLIDIITTLPPLSAVEQIKNTLSKINAYITFLAVIVKNAEGEKMPERANISLPPAEQPRENILPDLSQTEENTEKFLSPSGLVNLKKYFAFPLKITAGFGRKAAGNLRPDSLLKEKILFKRQPKFISFKKIYLALKNFFIYSINIIIFIVKNLSSREKIKAAAKMAAAGARKKILGITGWFKNLDKKRKIALLAALACFLLLAGNLIFIAYKKQQKNRDESYRQLVEALGQKENRLEASLLYKNEAEAKNLLEEIKIQLSEFPKENKEQTAQYDFFFKKYQENLEKIRHVLILENLAEIAKLKNLNPNADPQNIILTKGKGSEKIYAADLDGKTIYQVSPGDKNATSLTTTAKITKEASRDEEGSVYFLAENKVIKIEAEKNTAAEMAISLPEKLENLKAAPLLFNGRLYLLGKDNGQIYRYNKSGANWGEAAEWLAEKEDFKNAAGFDLDGSIYVLKNNGEANLFLKGEKLDFSLKEAEPLLTAPDKIILSQEMDYLYILEASQKRLIVFNKKGDFLWQYELPQLDKIKDFALDEKNKKIYFLQDDLIYQGEAEHLNK